MILPASAFPLMNAPVSAGGGFLLDSYSPKAAYSLRKLKSSAVNSIRIRRSSDSATLDIGFDSSGNLDEAAISSFIGSNDAYVVTQYDQTGNGWNLTQSNTSRQPLIALAGVIYKLNSLPSLYKNGTAQFLENTSITLTQPVTMFTVFQGSNGGVYMDANNATNAIGFWMNTTGINQFTILSDIPTTLTNNSNSTTALSQFYALYNTSSSESSFNQTTNASGTLNGGGIVSGGIRVMGNSSATSSINMYHSELIIFESNQSANKTTISGNQKSYWGTP